MKTRRGISCALLLLLIILGAGGCGDSTTSGDVSVGNQVATRATIAVLGHEDFLPDRTTVRPGNTVGLPDVLSSRIIEHLTNSKRFTPVERTALRKVILEQRFGKAVSATYLDNTLDKAISAMENVEAGTVAVAGALADYNDLLKDFQDLGTAVGADYLVIGNLEKLLRSTTETAVPFSTTGRTDRSNDVDGRVQLRVINVASGTVIGAASIRTKLSENVFEGKQTDADEYSFYDHLGRLTASKILDVTFPAEIVSAKPLLISRGMVDGVKNGDTYAVSREGKEVTDSSGQVIARLKSPVGTVKIIDTQETISVVQVVSGDDPEVGDLVSFDGSTGAVAAQVPRSASTPIEQGGAGTLPRLAVGLVKKGSTARTGDDAQEHTPLFTDSIISRLSQTKRFQLIDRQEVDQLLDEQFAQALAEDRDMASAMGTLEGADYLAYGSLDSSSLTSETETITLPNSSRSFQETKWYVSGNMRIVDARSGDILASRTIAIVETSPAQMSKERVITMLANAYADQVVLMLMNAIYPIKVAAVGQDNTLYINRGSDGGLSVGETLNAFRPGRPVIDPDTGVQLGVEEVLLGQVSLTEVEDARSKGVSVNRAILQSGDILKRNRDNRGKRSDEPSADSRSGAQFTGTPSKLADKDTKFTLAVGLIKVNPSARITGLTDGHVDRMSGDLMVKLANTNRFRVMERQEVDQILDEKDFEAATSGDSSISRLRELIGADYLVHSEISNFYIDTVTREVAILDEKETKTTAVAEGMLRLVDVHTGAIVGADKVRYSSSANNAQDTTQLMSDLMDKFTTESVAAIVLRLFPIKVLGQGGDGAVYINRGNDGGLTRGVRFDVMRPGEALIDPDTGLSFGTAETLVAQVEITSVEASRSRARIVSGETTVAGDILRPIRVSKESSEQKVNKPDW